MSERWNVPEHAIVRESSSRDGGPVLRSTAPPFDTHVAIPASHGVNEWSVR